MLHRLCLLPRDCTATNLGPHEFLAIENFQEKLKVSVFQKFQNEKISIKNCPPLL